MKLRLPLLLLVFGLWLWSRLAFAGVEQISETEFLKLAEDLAPKVNLFQAGWEKDPKAEFYGGTTRDYLYWLKGQFLEAQNRQQAEDIIKKLRALPIIDVRSFIIGDSDIDVISAGRHNLNANEFGVRKIDFQKPDILDPATELGQNELLQGYIPAEKVRLGKDGFQPSRLGDGINEIYTGKLSVHFASPEDFAKSKYAKEGINHPVLLALRYIRVQAINYFRSHGKDYPSAALLREGLDPDSAKQVKALIERAVSSGELAPLLEKDKFLSWINGAIQKSFRSYTNPTAALELMKLFGAMELPTRYPGKIEPLNQYVFAQYRDPEKIKAALLAHGVDEKKFFIPAKDFFPDGKLYHGTRTEEAFRGIVFQGVLPSDSGAALGGLYGVAAPDKSFSESWGHDKNRLLSFEVNPDAKIVDVTQGEGKRIWDALDSAQGNNYDTFAKLFGADIIRYPHTPQAFVVKNASVLGAAEGVYRKIMPVSALIEQARRISDPEELLDLFSVNALSTREVLLVQKASKVKIADFTPLIEKSGENPHHFLPTFLEYPFVFENPSIQQAVEKMIAKNQWIQETVISVSAGSPEFYAWLDRLILRPEVRKHVDLSFSLLRKMQDAPGRSANAMDFAISSVSRTGWVRSQAVDFLDGAKLEKSDLSRINDLLSPKLKKDNIDFRLAKMLLRHDSYRGETKKYLLDQFRASKDLERKSNALTALVQYFSGDTDIESEMIPFIKKYYDKIIARSGFRELPSISFVQTFAKNWPDSEQLKNFLLSKRNSANSDEALKAAQTLIQMHLKPEDMVQILRGKKNLELVNSFLSSYTHFDYAHLQVTDPALTRAFLDTGLEYLDSGFHNFYLNQALQKNGDPAALEKFFLEQFSESAKGPSDPQMQKLLGYIIPSLYYENPVSPVVAEALLGYLEKNPDGINEFLLNALPVENEAIALRAQNLYMATQYQVDKRSIQLIKRMPSISPEFREYLAGEHNGGLRAEDLEELRIIQRTTPSCGGAFALLAK